MPEMPKTERKEIDDENHRPTLSEGEKKRGYYYDDAHGYEPFDPESHEEVEEEEDPKGFC